MTIEEVINKFLRDKILIEEQGKIVLHSKYYPKTKKLDVLQKFNALLETYASLWPKGVTSGGRLVKRSPNSLKRKLLILTKERPDLNFEIIIEATKHYISKFKASNYAYISCADYFISKFKESELQNIADGILSGDIKKGSSENYIKSLN